MKSICIAEAVLYDLQIISNILYLVGKMKLKSIMTNNSFDK